MKPPLSSAKKESPSFISVAEGQRPRAPSTSSSNRASLLNAGKVRYTAPDGIPALKKAAVRYTEQHYKKIVSAKNVIASGGAQQALMVLLHAILDPNEEVVLQRLTESAIPR